MDTPRRLFSSLRVVAFLFILEGIYHLVGAVWNSIERRQVFLDFGVLVYLLIGFGLLVYRSRKYFKWRILVIGYIVVVLIVDVIKIGGILQFVSNPIDISELSVLPIQQVTKEMLLVLVVAGMLVRLWEIWVLFRKFEE